MKIKIASVAWSAAIAVSFGCTIACWNTQWEVASAADVAAATTGTTLEGGVQKVTVSLERLRDVGLDLKHLLKSVNGLYDEVTIQPVAMITEPEMIGPGVIINIPIGTRPVGPVEPPKKERVDMSMNEIRPAVTMMKNNVDAFVAGKTELDLPADVQQTLQPQITTWVSGVNQLSTQLGTLEQLTQGPTYDNSSIAAASVAMERQIKDLDKTRSQIYKEIRKEGKRRKFF